MEIRPIRTAEDHQWAVRRIEQIFDAEPGTPEDDELDILATLVSRYEETLWPIPAATAVEVLRFSMQQNGRSQADLAALLGSRSRASEILNGKRELNLGQIRRLARDWHIPVAALVGALEPA